MIGTIRGFAEEHGRPPLRKDWRVGRGAHAPDGRVVKLFGSWQQALVAAGFPPTSPEHRRWSDEEILEAIRSWQRKYGSGPRNSDWERASAEHPVRQLVQKRFGGFENARVLAGVPSPRWPYRRAPWTDQELREAVRSWVAVHGRVPSSREWAAPAENRPSAHVFRRRFGGWSVGLEELGFTPRLAPPQTWDRERITAALTSWASEHGRRPVSKDLRRSRGRLPSPPIVNRYFGTLDAALRAAGLPTARPDVSHPHAPR